MKNIFTVLIFSLFLCGCSNTWHGVKHDTKKNAEWTKEQIHDGAEWVTKKTE